MAGIKITDLPAVVTPALTDVFPIDQGAVTYKESLQQVITLFEGNIIITPTNFSGILPVANGGTGVSSVTAYSVLCGGTTSTNPFQSVASLGTAGEQLTSNGPGLLPTWQAGGTVSPLTTKGDLYTFTTVNARLPVGTINGQILQVNSGTATGLAWSTPTYPSISGAAGKLLRSDSTNNVYTTLTFPDTVVLNAILYGNVANNVGPITPAINSVLVSDGTTGIPSWSTTLPAGLIIPGYQTTLTLPLSLANGGTNASLVASNGGIFYSTATAGAILSGTATAGQLLQSGSNAAPSWTTATFPSVGGAAGNILISNGTNYISSTSLWPNTVGANGLFLISNGTTNTYSTSTIPASAGATANKVLLSDGTNYVLSTPTFPNASATTGKIIISDGTNWIASTPTYPAAAGTSGNVLTSDGTNWLSSAPAASGTVNAGTQNQLAYYAANGTAVSGLSTANNGLLVTSSAGVPSVLAGPGTTGNILQSNAAAAPSFSTATYPSTAGAAGSVIISDGTNKITSTSLWPNTVGSTGTLLRSNGTSNAYTTSTYPDTNAVSTLLYASSSNVMSSLATANNGTLVTSNTGVPSILAGPGVANQALISNAAAAPSFGPIITSGTYTPNLRNNSNVDSSTAYSSQYLRVGSTVTVSGRVDIDPTLTLTNTNVGISLPIASNFANLNEGCGVGSSNSLLVSGGIFADSTNDEVSFVFFSQNTASAAYFYTFTYRII